MQRWTRSSSGGAVATAQSLVVWHAHVRGVEFVQLLHALLLALNGCGFARRRALVPAAIARFDDRAVASADVVALFLAGMQTDRDRWCGQGLRLKQTELQSINGTVPAVSKVGW
ncbi:MAG: hypothetical protein EOP82_00570 [Variovorax sp.]|nr:MAG: hypothetical protein EOP82_00570 [Variovorax sp.]